MRRRVRQGLGQPLWGQRRPRPGAQALGEVRRHPHRAELRRRRFAV